MLSEDDVALMADAVIRELGSDMSRLRNSSMTLPTDALRREIGTSVYEGVAEDIETPIIRTGGPLVTEDVEDGFAR
jgi:hypothetical protein